MTIRLILVSMILSLLPGCASVATVLSCGAEAFSREPVDSKYFYLVDLESETSDGTTDITESVECEIIDHACGSGSWYPKWKRSPDAGYYELRASDGSVVTIEAPNCTMLKQEAGDSPTTYIYSSVIHPNAGMNGRGNTRKLLREESLAEHGIWLRKYTVRRIEK